MKLRYLRDKSYRIYYLLMIILPGFLLIGISVKSITKQKDSKILELNKAYTQKAKQLTEDIETDIERYFKNSLYQLKETKNIDKISSELLINLIKNMMLKNPIIHFPFLISENGKYLFPIRHKKNVKNKIVKKINRYSSLEKLMKTNKYVKKNYSLAEKNEFETKKYLIAIKYYLKIFKKSNDISIKNDIYYSVSRCYCKNRDYIQAIEYLEDIYRNILIQENDYYFKFKVLYDMAKCYDKLNLISKSIELHINLYENILKFEKLTNRNDYSSLKTDISQYLIKKLEKNNMAKKYIDKVKKEQGNENLSNLDLKLRWIFPDNEEDIREISKGNRFRFKRIKSFYLNSDEKTIFYRNVLASKFWLSDIKPLYVYYKTLEKAKNKTKIIYSKIIEVGGNDVYFGYCISILGVKPKIIPSLLGKYFKNQKINIIIGSTNSNLSDNRIIGSAIFKKYLSDTRLFILSERPNYINDIVRKELIINYIIIAFLLFMLILGIILFLKIYKKEQALIKMKSNFVDSVSHTLKTPLTRIRLLSEKLELGWINDVKKKDEMLKSIQIETEMMSETIENMLNFTKIDSGRAIYTKKDLNLAVYLKTLIDNYEQFLTSKGFSLKVNISDAIPVIKFDREAFKLIFINLIQNSIKYSTKIKKIEIDLFFSDNRIIFKVADRGIGIPEKNIEMLFNKFYRAENNLVKSIEGSGLGLFLVKHALDEHDGLISIKNRDGGGTEVRIVFNLFEKGVSK